MSTKDLVLVALFAALLAVLGIVPALTVPLLAVPITAQTLGVMLAGSVLGAKRGGLAVLVFLALVAAGLPLLAGGRGGIGIFAGPSGGFLVSWPIAAFIIGLLTQRFWPRYNLVSAIMINILGGVLVVYGFGISWLVLGLGFDSITASTGSAAFIPGDLVKAVLASLVSVTLSRYHQHPIGIQKSRRP